MKEAQILNATLKLQVLHQTMIFMLESIKDQTETSQLSLELLLIMLS